MGNTDNSTDYIFICDSTTDRQIILNYIFKNVIKLYFI